MKDVCDVIVEPDDVFDAKTVQGRKLRKIADYEGVRIKFVGLLERARIAMQLMVGFGDVIHPG